MRAGRMPPRRRMPAPSTTGAESTSESIAGAIAAPRSLSADYSNGGEDQQHEDGESR